MDGHEFDFPPDHVSNEVRTPILHGMPATLPFGLLVRTPVDELPPTPASATPHCTIGQLLRGGLHGHASRNSLGGVGATMSNGSTPRGVQPRPTPTAMHIGPRDNDEFWLDEPTGSAHHSSHPERSAALLSSTAHPDGKLGERRRPSVSTSGGSDPEIEETQPHDGSHDDSNGAHKALLHRHQRLEWTEKEVRDFYKALSQFGTDFGAIAVLFPNRDRNQVKKLYQREYRKHRAEVLRALENKEEIDVEAYQQLLKERKALEAPKKKKLAVSDEELLTEIASGPVAQAHAPVTAAGGEMVSAAAGDDKHCNNNNINIDMDAEDYGDFTVAEFATRMMSAPVGSHKSTSAQNAKRKDVANSTETTSPGRKRERDGKSDSPLRKPKATRHDHDASATAPASEETLFDMMLREDDQFEHQTLLEAALDGQFGSVFTKDGENKPSDNADDFTF